MKKWTLLIDTSDEKGLIHKITGVLFYQNLNVVQTNEFVDTIVNIKPIRTTKILQEVIKLSVVFI